MRKKHKLPEMFTYRILVKTGTQYQVDTYNAFTDQIEFTRVLSDEDVTLGIDLTCEIIQFLADYDVLRKRYEGLILEKLDNRVRVFGLTEEVGLYVAGILGIQLDSGNRYVDFIMETQ